MTPKTVFITGATGLIGSEVVARLIGERYAVIALVHSNPVLQRNNGRTIRCSDWTGQPAPGSVAAVRGDIRRPMLGLPADVYERIRSTVDCVVHTAAITDFGREQSVYEQVNVQGTANVLALVRPEGKVPIPLVHVSTAYVCGERTGDVLEEELDAGQPFRTGYEESKFRAEKMVRAAGGPYAVVRPSIVVGTEKSGVVREFQNMYVVIKALSEGRVRSIPGFYDALLDLVPVDHVADVVATAVIRFEEAQGRTFHAIGHEPHTLRDFSDVMAEYPSFHVPRYIPPSNFDRDQLPPAERIYYERIVGLYETFFRKRMIFHDDNAAALVGKRPSLPAKRYLRRLFDHCVKVGYLGNPLPSLDDVLADLTSDR